VFWSPVDIAYFPPVLQHGTSTIPASTCLCRQVFTQAFDFSVHRRVLPSYPYLPTAYPRIAPFSASMKALHGFTNGESGWLGFISRHLNLPWSVDQARQGRLSKLGCLLYTLLSTLIVVVNRCLWITRGSSLSSYLSTTCAIFLAWRSVNLWCTRKMNNFFHRRNKQAYPETINRLCTSGSPSRCPQAC